MIDRKKVFLSLVVLATLVASISMLIGNRLSGAAVHAQRANAQSVTSTDFAAPQGTADAWGTAFDSHGHVWVAMPGCDLAPQCSSTFPGKISEFDPATTSWIITYSLPAGYGQPIFLAFDPQGNVWFTMPMSNTIGMLNPTNGTTQQFAVPTSASGPWGVAVDSKGIVWFTEHYANKIGSFNPTTHAFHEIATSVANSVPYGITVDSSDNVWFTENNPSAPAVAEYPANGGALKEFPMAPNGSSLTPHMITVDTHGNIWWSEGFVGAIGELKVASAVPGTSNGITHYSYHLNSTHTSGISVDSSGQIWFDDSIQSIYGSFPESGNGSFSIYNTPTQNSHPHDGLNVDKQNNVWFNEQYIDKLALATQSGGTTPTPTAPTSTPTPGQVVAKDTFQRANQAHWGKASDGQTWGGDSGSVNAFAITGNTGTVSNGGSTSYSAVLGSSVADVEVLVSGSLSNYAGANFGAVLRWTDGNDWYKAYIDGGTFYIQKRVAGTTTLLTSTSFAAKANTAYTIRFQAIGTKLSAKVWATGSTEPSGWTLTTSDTSLTTGYTGVRVLTQGGTATFTSFQATALGTGSTPTPTPTIGTTPTVGTSPTPSPTIGTSPTPTATTPPSGQPLGTDTFQRANQARWGNASDGQAWGGDANLYNNFSITNKAGVVTNSGNNIYSAVLGPSTTNAEVVLSGSLTSYANANFGAVLRWTDANNWYKAYMSGSTFYIQKKIAGNATFIASAPFTANANTSYTIRFRIVGTTLSAKVWATGSTEPSAWTVTATDTSIAAGYCGIRMQTQSGTATITSFTATTA